MRSYIDIFYLIHSILRYFVLIFTLLVAVQGLMAMTGKKGLTTPLKKSALFMLISCDVQLLVGLAVFYFSGHLLMLKTGAATANHYNRFFSIEHPVSMVLGIILVHVGYSVLKKEVDDSKKVKKLFWCAAIAFLLFFSQTPWPFKKDVGKPWISNAYPFQATQSVAMAN